MTVGLIGGFILASAGIIGPLLVPALLFLGLPSGVARGTTLLSELPITLFAVILRVRQQGKKENKKHIDKKITLALLPGAFFVVLGANFSIQFSELRMKTAIGILEMVVGGIVIYKTRKLANEQGPQTAVITRSEMVKFMTAAVIAGLIKGFSGLGWGPISVGLLLAMGIDPLRAVGSSLVVRLLLDFLGGISYVNMNLVDFNAVIALTLAGAITVIPAIKWTTTARKKTLNTFLGCVIIFFGALVIFGAMTTIP